MKQEKPMYAHALKMNSEIQDEIKRLCVERYKNPGDFIEFAESLRSLGIVRQSYDVLSNSLIFYNHDATICQIAVEEIEPSIEKKAFSIGKVLNINQLQKAIENFDNNQLTVLEFHQEVAASGIVYVSVFLNQNKIYYMGQDGSHFVELFDH